MVGTVRGGATSIVPPKETVQGRGVIGALVATDDSTGLLKALAFFLVELVAFLPLSGAFFSGGAFFGREGRCFFVGGEEEEGDDGGDEGVKAGSFWPRLERLDFLVWL